AACIDPVAVVGVIAVCRVSGEVERDRPGIGRRGRPVELKDRAVPGADARAGRGVLNECNASTRPGSSVFADHLGHVVDAGEVARLAILQVAVQARGHFKAPAALIRIGYLDGNSLPDAWNIERAALQERLHASRSGIETARMTGSTSSGIVPGGAGHTSGRPI